MTQSVANAKDLIIIGLDTKDGPEHALYDARIKDKLLPTDVEHVKTYGVQLPVAVWNQKGKLVVIDGKQRVRWAREAKKDVPYREIEIKDEKAAFAMLVALNEHRRNDSLLEKVAKLEKFLELEGTKEEAAKAFRVTRVAVANWLLLSSAVPALKKGIKDELISATAAIELARLAPEKQEEKLKELLKTVKPGKKGTSKKAKTARKGSSRVPDKELRRLIESDVLDETVKIAFQFVLGDCEVYAVPTLEDAIEALDEEGGE